MNSLKKKRSENDSFLNNEHCIILLFTHSFAKFTLNIFYIQGTLLDVHHYGGGILPLAWNKPSSALPAATKWSKEETPQRATSGSFLFGHDLFLLSQRKK